MAVPPAPLHVVRSGVGPPTLLLVHGSMDRAAGFARLTARLGPAEVVAYDRRGYAGSRRRPPSDRVDDQVEDLLEVLDRLGDRPVTAFGHSLGGVIVLAALARRPGCLAGALVWEPPQPWLPWWPATASGRVAAADPGLPPDVAERFLRRMLGDPVWERLPPSTRAARRADGPALVAEMRGLEAGPPFEPSAVVDPVHVGRGTDSQPYQRRGAADLADALPAGTLVEVAGCGHGVHLSHPSQLAALLRRAACGLGARP